MATLFEQMMQHNDLLEDNKKMTLEGLRKIPALDLHNTLKQVAESTQRDAETQTALLDNTIRQAVAPTVDMTGQNAITVDKTFSAPEQRLDSVVQKQPKEKTKLGTFLTSVGHSMLGMPIEAQTGNNPSWINYLGANIGNEIKDMRVTENGVPVKTTSPEFYNTAKDRFTQKQAVEKAESLMNQKFSEEDIDAIAEQVANGEFSPDQLRGLYGQKPRVMAALAKKGVDYKTIERDWMKTKKQISSAGSPQQLRLKQAIDSVRYSLPELQDLNDSFVRGNLKPLNYIQIGAGTNGITLNKKAADKLNPDQQDALMRYLTQINLVRDEAAQVFSGGYAPSESAFKLVDEIMNPAYNGKQMTSVIDQLGRNLNIRERAIGEVSGYGAFREQGATPVSETGVTQSGNKFRKVQ